MSAPPVSTNPFRADLGSRKGPIKVVHFIECWLPLTETWLYSHINALPSFVESHVVCQWTANLDRFPLRNLTSLNAPPRKLNLLERGCRKAGIWDYWERHLRLLSQVIRQTRPDLLHSHFGHYGYINAKITSKYDLPHVVSFYGFDVGYLPRTQPRWRSKYQSLSARVDRILCEGPHMADSISRLGPDRAQIDVFRLGIDLDRIPFMPRQNPGRDLRFLIAGSFREKKGIPYGLEALGLFTRAHPDFRLKITIIGDAGESPREQDEKRKILAVVKRFGLEEMVNYMGYQRHDTLISEFYRHDLFLSPSITSTDGDTEGGAPVTIIEAAASGMPIITTDHCDIPFVLSQPNRALLAPERDAEALCRAIDKLICRTDWGQLALANRDLIETELDVRRQGERLAAIYRSVLERR